VLGTPAGADAREYYASIHRERAGRDVAQVVRSRASRSSWRARGGRDSIFQRLRDTHPEVLQFPTPRSARPQTVAGQQKAALETLERARELAATQRAGHRALRRSLGCRRAARSGRTRCCCDLFNNVPPSQEQIRLTAIAANAAGDVPTPTPTWPSTTSWRRPAARDQPARARAVGAEPPRCIVRSQRRLKELREALPKERARWNAAPGAARTPGG